jgi:hypothetical protein
MLRKTPVSSVHQDQPNGGGSGGGNNISNLFCPPPLLPLKGEFSIRQCLAPTPEWEIGKWFSGLAFRENHLYNPHINWYPFFNIIPFGTSVRINNYGTIIKLNKSDDNKKP